MHDSSVEYTMVYCTQNLPCSPWYRAHFGHLPPSAPKIWRVAFTSPPLPPPPLVVSRRGGAFPLFPPSYPPPPIFRSSLPTSILPQTSSPVFFASYHTLGGGRFPTSFRRKKRRKQSKTMLHAANEIFRLLFFLFEGKNILHCVRCARAALKCCCNLPPSHACFQLSSFSSWLKTIPSHPQLSPSK